MACESVTLPGGTRAIVCGPRRKQKRCECGAVATLECDWKVPERKSGTCDAPICSSCTFSPAPGKDLCTAHQQEFEHWKAAHA